jgi:hypothetical protein
MMGYLLGHFIANSLITYAFHLLVLGDRMFSKDKKVVELFPDVFDPSLSKSTLAQRIQRSPEDYEASSGLVHQRAQFYINPSNEDIWGEVADNVAMAMLSILVEYEAYDIAKEVLSILGLVACHLSYKLCVRSIKFDLTLQV